MQPVSLSDEIVLESAPALSITTGGWPPSRADDTNLAYRAALTLKHETGYAAALSTMLFVVLFFINLIYIRLLRIGKEG